MKKFPIGFFAGEKEKTTENMHGNGVKTVTVPKKSVVQVYFDSINRSYAYYNDSFDLKVGDWVYVEGKLEGVRGRVCEVNYCFKIKISDYKKVVFLVDTNVQGDFYLSGSHAVVFEKTALPYEKARNWYIPPENGEEDYVSGESGTSFPISDFSKMGVSLETGKKGHELYMDNAVVYGEIDLTKARAIVEGSKFYEIEFTFSDSFVSNLTCSCYSSGYCKHAVAAMYQFRESLEIIEDMYSDKYLDYFATIEKTEFIKMGILKKSKGKISIDT